MHKALGKGLDSLISTTPVISDAKARETMMFIPIDKIKPNKYQSRILFNEENLQELSNSIKKYGLAQPILVSPSMVLGEYDLVAGERRLRACRIAGLNKIPAVVRPTSEKEKFQLSLIENLQRDNLNPIEEAEGFHRIVTEFNLTQEELSDMIGLGRSRIANTMRLLNLPEEIQYAIKQGVIPAGHARALVVIDDPKKQKELAHRIIKEKLTAREVEEIVQSWKHALSKGLVKIKKKSPEIVEIENQLQNILGTKIIIKNKKQKGWINIAYYSIDHFESLVSTLKGRFKNSVP